MSDPDSSQTQAGPVKPINWWRIVAAASMPLFLWSTWNYAETHAKFQHHLEHCQGGSFHSHGHSHGDADGEESHDHGSEAGDQSP